ncbi:hypothetical protein QJS04_geneDACA009586 [Acorus gramineus]|uniref:Uncharacterized protein n=1 Tax=Acorus gramineus TaxID=55184 RepID=A0AAV9BB05_ACOGR|nr:hypothetical protein QJS04_geneDACA009586 [Acorus gramineus]
MDPIRTIASPNFPAQYDPCLLLLFTMRVVERSLISVSSDVNNPLHLFRFL